MGQSDYGTGTKCIRITFIICNGVFLVLAILGFAIGVWSVAENAGNDDYDVITGDSSLSSGVLLLVSSIVAFGLCAAGLIGGIFMWRPFLIVYAIILGIIIILELISAILAFVYADNARDILEDNFEEAVERYRVFENDTDYDDDVNSAVDNVQDALDCCGITDYMDWERLNPEAVADNGGIVPPADCNCDRGEDDCVAYLYNGTATGGYVWEDGCLDTLETFTRVFAIASGVVSLIVMFIEIFFLLIAIGLTITITKTRGKGSVV